jgi:class 3 adenylate cyclase
VPYVTRAVVLLMHNVRMTTKLRSDRLRIDIQTEVTDVLPDGTLKVVMRPDPGRYEQIRGEDGWQLHDRQTDLTFSAAVSRGIMQQIAENMPKVLVYAPPEVPEARALIIERQRAIRAVLDGTAKPEALSDPSSAALANLAGRDLTFAVVCIDLVGSTSLQAERPADSNRLVSLLLGEIAAVSAVFGGLVIKYTGDGALVGFPDPGFCVAADTAFDAATAIVAVVYMALNPLAQKFGLPPINVRVGVDANNASVHMIGHASNRRQADVLGIAVSMASKVQGRGAPEEVWVGQYLHEILHVSRQELLLPVSPSTNWAYVDRFDDPYRLYHMRINASGQVMSSTL